MIKQGKTIFMIEHDPDFVKQVADTVAFMHNKKIEAIDRTDEVLNNSPTYVPHILAKNIPVRQAPPKTTKGLKIKSF